MSFASWLEFFAMGGHALYVWPSYGLSLLVLVVVMLMPVLRRRQLTREIDRERRRSERAKRT